MAALPHALITKQPAQRWSLASRRRSGFEDLDAVGRSRPRDAGLRHQVDSDHAVAARSYAEGLCYRCEVHSVRVGENVIIWVEQIAVNFYVKDFVARVGVETGEVKPDVLRDGRNARNGVRQRYARRIALPLRGIDGLGRRVGHSVRGDRVVGVVGNAAVWH